MSDSLLVGPNQGTGFVIREVWVAVVVHGDGDEAVPAVMSPDGMWFPLIAADPTRFEWLTAQAREMARRANKPVHIVKFTTREMLETLHPDGRRVRP